MKSLLFALIFIAAQAITMQDKPVVHLKPHSNTIDSNSRGSLVDLSNAPATVYLPATLPVPDADGGPWSVDVKNFGPAPVKIVGRQNFNALISVGQTIHILVNGQGYVLKH
ncbi:hypothetical protein H7849_03565 [Alloacidobacterium dinghuense]|uniref:Uncharacterized protein n=1 Tax=Alloacidobacterium dinghuense TaxID=2763107 RepID=A0A7G8BKJ7_9BACT|nr:hypothetical protein [Alloacidobacterium dinghuense]QNI33067.1 hypothetical protein H7849_03565 [Alloacidobacterium dinghuense]